MSRLRMLDESFEPREHEKAQLDFSDELAALQTTITLRLKEPALDRALDFCDVENARTDGDGRYLVDFPFIENTYYYNILLGFGS